MRQYLCRFCTYSYISTSGFVLEQHVRLLHQLELTTAKAKAAAAAAVAKAQSEKLPKSPKGKTKFFVEHELETKHFVCVVQRWNQ